MFHWENDLSTYEENSVAATFASQLNDLESRFPDASNFLKVLSFLDPECIPLAMITQGAQDTLASRKAEMEQEKTSSHTKLEALLGLISSTIELHSAIAQLQNRSLVRHKPNVDTSHRTTDTSKHNVDRSV